MMLIIISALETIETTDILVLGVRIRKHVINTMEMTIMNLLKHQIIAVIVVMTFANVAGTPTTGGKNNCANDAH